MGESDRGTETWDVDGVSVFRALGYVVGLPSFIVGTALFMLGFSLLNASVLNAACMLYSLAIVAILGRVVLARMQPQNEKQALLVALGSISSMAALYGLLMAVLWGLDFPTVY